MLAKFLWWTKTKTSFTVIAFFPLLYFFFCLFFLLFHIRFMTFIKMKVCVRKKILCFAQIYFLPLFFNLIFHFFFLFFFLCKKYVFFQYRKNIRWLFLVFQNFFSFFFSFPFLTNLRHISIYPRLRVEMKKKKKQNKTNKYKPSKKLKYFLIFSNVYSNFTKGIFVDKMGSRKFQFFFSSFEYCRI